MTRPLTMVTRSSGANRALKSGEIPVGTRRIEQVEVPVLVGAFRRMVRQLAFDICEMALTTYLCAKEHGVPFTAIPVFLVRGLHHSAMVTTDPDIAKDPTVLHGQRVGVNRGYTVTTGVWARAILAAERGLDLQRVTWVPTGEEHVTTYKRPPNVTSPVPDLEAALRSGHVSAAVGARPSVPGAQSLFSDPEAAALASLARTGLYPINHLVVVRDDLLTEDPHLAAQLFEAFIAAKQPYLEKLATDPGGSESATDTMHRRVMATLGVADPLPYGIEPNRAVLEALFDHALAQGILTQRPDIRDVFARTTLGRTG